MLDDVVRLDKRDRRDVLQPIESGCHRPFDFDSLDTALRGASLSCRPETFDQLSADSIESGLLRGGGGARLEADNQFPGNIRGER